MALRIVYKGQDSKQCGFTEATRLVAEEGWAWKPGQIVKAKKTSVKAKKPKVKVKAEADVIKENDFNDYNEEK
tara:strand:- start:1425 stop:1643 length:219 start_codon:yes stop_codon:yes gene_type:complete